MFGSYDIPSGDSADNASCHCSMERESPLPLRREAIKWQGKNEESQFPQR